MDETDVNRKIIRLNDKVGAIMLELNRPGHTEREREDLLEQLSLTRERLYLARQRTASGTPLVQWFRRLWTRA